MKVNSTKFSGTLFELLDNSNLTIQDCHLSSRNGSNELISTAQNTRPHVEIASTTINGFTSLTSGGLPSLSLRETAVGDCQGAAVVLGDFARCEATGCSFASVAGPCFLVRPRPGRLIPQLLLRKCAFTALGQEAVRVEGPDPDVPCLDLQITECVFEDCEHRAIQVTMANCMPLLIAQCKFSKIQDDCVVIDGCRNYRIFGCNFEFIDGVGLSIFGGQGLVEKSFFNKGVTGLRILGEPQTKPIEKKLGSTPLNSPLKPLNLRPILQTRSTIEVNQCTFEQLIGNGIEVTDTLMIDCNFTENIIRECLNGILVRDFTSNNFSSQILNSDRTYGGTKTNSYNSMGSPIISTTQIELRSYHLINNLIQKNKGSGLKIENTLTPVHVTGGEIGKNKDLAIGVIGMIEKGVKIQNSGINKVNVSGDIKEIRFEDGSKDSNKCSVI